MVNDSSSLAPKKGRPKKKTTGLNKKAPSAKSNDENIPPDHVEQVLDRPSSDHNIQRKPKSRAVKRQLF